MMGTCSTCRWWGPAKAEFSAAYARTDAEFRLCDYMVPIHDRPDRPMVMLATPLPDGVLTASVFSCAAYQPHAEAAPAGEYPSEYEDFLADAERGSPHLTPYMGKALAHILKRLGPPA